MSSVAKRILVRCACTLLGCAVTAGVYAATAFLTSESTLGVAFLVVAPAALLGGGFVAGVLPRPAVKRSALAALFFSPGLWLYAVMLLFWIAEEGTAGMAALGVIWVPVSWLGVLAGARFRSHHEAWGSGVCPKCGGSLDSALDGRCSECGTVVGGAKVVGGQGRVE